MRRAFSVIQTLDRILNGAAGVALVFIVILTTADVLLRMAESPIMGTYEIVGYAGAVVILFSLPRTTWGRSHIFVDFFILKFSPRQRNVFHVFTRLTVLALFILFGLSAFKFGLDLRESGEVSPTLGFRFYPVVFAAAVCCFVQCLTILCDFVKIFRGEYE